MKSRVFLEGKRIILRGLEPEDVNGNYINWFDDEEVCNGNTHHRVPYSKASMSSFIEHSYSDEKIVLAIFDKTKNVHIGNISLQDIDHLNQMAEFAIILGEKSYWGKGFSTEAGSLIIKHGFDQLNLHRIYLGTFSENIGMQKLALKLGFMEEGKRSEAIFKNGKFVDIVEYGLLKRDWIKLNGQK